MAEGAELVVDHFDEIVKPDGGSVRLLGREGERLRVGYKPGTNEECASCTISPGTRGILGAEAWYASFLLAL